MARKGLLMISLFVNIGFLLVFKYCNFFIDSFVDFCSIFNYQPSLSTLNIVLPVGISFYTFQTLSYSIDVYRRKLEPTQNIFNFFTYVSFFPQLVAGPIERAINLLPQIETKRTFNYETAKDGLRQILWGLFKKVAIADNCAMVVNPIFANYAEFGSISLIIGAIFFTIQLYCDFSGYSDIAIGTAKLLGIKLMQNFNYPFFSRDIAEFWRRWHISLSTWFRDYVYIPLGGSRVSKWFQIRNIFAMFLISGFWHGANWTFIFWALLHSLWYLPLVLIKKNRKNLRVVAEGKILPSFVEFFQIIKTFLILTITLVFFRADSINEAFQFQCSMFTNFYWDDLFFDKTNVNKEYFCFTLIFITLMFMVEWLNRTASFGLQKMPQNKIIRYIIYIFLCLIVLQFFFGKNEFIYFQF